MKTKQFSLRYKELPAFGEFVESSFLLDREFRSKNPSTACPTRPGGLRHSGERSDGSARMTFVVRQGLYLMLFGLSPSIFCLEAWKLLHGR